MPVSYTKLPAVSHKSFFWARYISLKPVYCTLPPYVLPSLWMFVHWPQVYGQVYVPVINYLLMTLTLIVVGTFKTSAKMGTAYGENRSLAVLMVTVDNHSSEKGVHLCDRCSLAHISGLQSCWPM